MDYEYLSQCLASLSGLPVRLYRDGKRVFSCHSASFEPDPVDAEEANIFRNQAPVSYYMTDQFLFYGLFRLKDEPVCMLAGPVSQLPLDLRGARALLLSMGEAATRATELLNYLQTIPNYPLRTFLQILCTFAYVFNGEKLSASDILVSDLDVPSAPVDASEAAAYYDDGSVHNHNTYELEQTLLSCIEHGRLEEMQKLYHQIPAGRAGKMAQDGLRQEKNLIIVTATLASRAAIRGGMDVETALALSDLYIQKAELMGSYEGLARLNVDLTLEYARRVAALQCGDSARKLIRDARGYILEHITEKITTEQLAAHLHANRTYLCSVFREETGLSINHYITNMKVDEAKRLLEVTDKSLSDISEHLGFSSQSYFQNVFRKYTGMTPLQYREQCR